MPPVFGHGRLRLYLLKLLDEAPRHGYEVIRLLEERFHGLYAPSAGTVYPRLAKLEQEGLVTHATETGRKVYRLTDAGRAELAARQGELAELEAEIHESVAQLAGAIREDVRDSAKDLREELRRAAGQAAARPESGPGAGDPWAGPWGDREAWQRAKEEFAQFKHQTKEQVRRSREQEREAKARVKAAEEEARRVREQSRAARSAAQEEVMRLKRRMEQRIREAHAGGDWSTGVAEGISELTKGLASIADAWGGQQRPPQDEAAGEDIKREAGKRGDIKRGDSKDEDTKVTRIDLDEEPPAGLPDWARTDPSADSARELERLLDRFRDRIRDAARDGGVTPHQLAATQRALARAMRDILG